MDLEPVRDAYARIHQDYIDLCGSVADHPDDTAIVDRHLTGLAGTVLDLGCGPGHWSGRLHALGADVVGVDVVPVFLDHARTTHPGPEFRLDSMTDLDLTAAGILSWYSTIHVPPAELGDVLAGFRRLLAPSGVLVLGFFDSHDGVAAFDHKVVTAYRYPVDVMAAQLSAVGFAELERLQRQVPERPDRKYAAIAARAV